MNYLHTQNHVLHKTVMKDESPFLKRMYTCTMYMLGTFQKVQISLWQGNIRIIKQ